MSLLLTLRNTTTGLSAEELVAGVPGYASGDPATNPVSARRKFERDKDTLRELGIEVTTTGRPDEPRYRIDDEEYTLPALHLSAEQAACLSLAASAWRDGDLPATARPGSTRARTVEPHHLRLAEGAWYLDAVEPTSSHDTDSSKDPEEPEGTSIRMLTFRLARIAGPVTVHGHPGAFTRLPANAPSRQRALLAALPGRALGLRLAGAHLDPAQDPPADLLTHLEGRDLIAVEYEDPFSFAGTVAALGEAVVVLAPDSLRQAVLSHLRGAAGLTAPEGE